jgi:hypothetical protein
VETLAVTDSRCVPPSATISRLFRFLLRLEGGKPNDRVPAGLNSVEFVAEGFNGVFTVEPVEPLNG